MPLTTFRNLTLVRQADENIRVTVTYNALFTAFERNLASLGMTFRERIAVMGMDPPGSVTGSVLAEFPVAQIPVPAGSGEVSVARNRQIVLNRFQLDEDPSWLGLAELDADEIRCRIRIESQGLPPAVTPDAFTNERILSGSLIPTPDPNAAATAALSTSD